MAAAAKQRRTGPKSKYDPAFPEQAKKLASSGAALHEIADHFDISVRTLSRWLVTHPELRAAVDTGIEIFAPRIERSLAEKAMGFWVTWEEEEINPVSGEKYWAFKQRYFPPDGNAQQFYLTNVAKHKWRHVQKHEVEVKRESADEILKCIHAKLLDLKAKGYLQGVVVPALPPPKGEGRDRGPTKKPLNKR
jgi:hypothetical protein